MNVILYQAHNQLFDMGVRGQYTRGQIRSARQHPHRVMRLVSHCFGLNVGLETL